MQLHPSLLLQTDRPQASESVHVPNKRAKNDTAAAVSVENEAGAQSPGQAEPAASAAPAAPVCGGFGGLASKGASGFAFGGNSTFGSGGFGSVAFGGNTFASSGMGANSFTTKASKDKQDDRGSPSVASNAGSVQQQHQQQQIGVFTSTADAGGAGPSNMPVFGTTNSAIEGTNLRVFLCHTSAACSAISCWRNSHQGIHALHCTTERGVRFDRPTTHCVAILF